MPKSALSVFGSRQVATQATTKQMANTNGIASLLELLMMQVDLWRCETALGVGDDLYGDPLGYLGFHEHAFTLRATDAAGAIDPAKRSMNKAQAA